MMCLNSYLYFCLWEQNTKIFIKNLSKTLKDFGLKLLMMFFGIRNLQKFYENCRVISEDTELSKARVKLILACKIVLKNTLEIMGINAPERM